MPKIYQLTNNSWIIRAGVDDSGLLFKKLEGYLFLSATKRIEFNSMNDVSKRFGKLQEEIRENKDTQLSIISGFPVRHDNITVISEDPPLYTKGTDLIFAAGYWCEKCATGWNLSFCPKQKTTQKPDVIGPFKNRLEAMNKMNSLNNMKVIESRHGQ
jgi:hypothetical protein